MVKYTVSWCKKDGKKQFDKLDSFSKALGKYTQLIDENECNFVMIYKKHVIRNWNRRDGDVFTARR